MNLTSQSRLVLSLKKKIVTKNVDRQNFVEFIFIRVFFVHNCILMQSNGIKRLNLGVRVIYFTLSDT